MVYKNRVDGKMPINSIYRTARKTPHGKLFTMGCSDNLSVNTGISTAKA